MPATSCRLENVYFVYHAVPKHEDRFYLILVNKKGAYKSVHNSGTGTSTSFYLPFFVGLHAVPCSIGFDGTALRRLFFMISHGTCHDTLWAPLVAMPWHADAGVHPVLALHELSSGFSWQGTDQYITWVFSWNCPRQCHERKSMVLPEKVRAVQSRHGAYCCSIVPVSTLPYFITSIQLCVVCARHQEKPNLPVKPQNFYYCCCKYVSCEFD